MFILGNMFEIQIITPTAPVLPQDALEIVGGTSLAGRMR
jgi:hypothetical protein